MKIVKDDLKVVGIFFLIAVFGMCVTIPLNLLLIWWHPPLREFLLIINTPIGGLILLLGMDRFVLTDAYFDSLKDSRDGDND